MDINSKLALIEKKLQANEYCRAGLFGASKAYASNTWKNNAGNPEILTLICMSELTHGAWYGYIGPSMQNENHHVVMIVHMHKFINADSPENLFGYFNSQTTTLGAFCPCKIQNQNDAYVEVSSFDDAVESLIAMIGNFNPQLRDPDLDSHHYTDQIELRTVGHFGFRRWL